MLLGLDDSFVDGLDESLQSVDCQVRPIRLEIFRTGRHQKLVVPGLHEPVVERGGRRPIE